MIQITVTLALVGFIARHDAATQGEQPAEKSGDQENRGEWSPLRSIQAADSTNQRIIVHSRSYSLKSDKQHEGGKIVAPANGFRIVFVPAITRIP